MNENTNGLLLIIIAILLFGSGAVLGFFTTLFWIIVVIIIIAVLVYSVTDIVKRQKEAYEKHPTAIIIFGLFTIVFFSWLIIAGKNQSSNKNTINTQFQPQYSPNIPTTQPEETIILPTASPTIQQSNKNNYPKTTKGDSKPFWTDTEIIQVCKVPYYPTENCHNLDVTLVNDTTTQIHFSNGEYKITNNLTCYAGNGRWQEPKYIFCRSWDSDNQQWDFFPTWHKL